MAGPVWKPADVNGATIDAADAPADEAVDAYARSVAQAFRETAQFYASMNARRNIESIYVAGGHARLPGLQAKLSKIGRAHV